jgi:hypothetical protein
MQNNETAGSEDSRPRTVFPFLGTVTAASFSRFKVKTYIKVTYKISTKYPLVSTIP